MEQWPAWLIDALALPTLHRDVRCVSWGSGRFNDVATAPVRLDPWGAVPQPRHAAVARVPVLARLFAHVEKCTAAEIPKEAQAASIAHCSPSVLKRRFSMRAGMTFRKWREHVVMAAAEEMLAERGLPVKEVARLTAYSSESAFTRAFTHYERMGPGEFVRRRAERQTPGD